MNFLNILLLSLLFQASHPGVILNKIKSPSPCPTGLALKGTSLWVVDRFTYKIYEIDKNTGNLKKTIPAPCYQPFGLCFDAKGNLWVASDIPECGSDKLYKLDPEDGKVLKVVPAPCDFIRSLGFVQNKLIAGTRKNIFAYVDPDDGSMLKRLPGVSGQVDGIAYDGKYIWTGDKKKDKIYCVDPYTGEVIFYLPAPAPALSGLAAEPNFLYVIDYQTRNIYKISTKGDKYFWTQSPRKLNLCFRVIAHNEGQNPADITVWIAIPQDNIRQTILMGPGFSPEPNSFEKDEWGTNFAKFLFKNIMPGKTIEIKMTAKVQLKTLIRCIYPETVKSLDEIPNDVKEKYLRDGIKYQLKDKYLRKLVENTIGKEKNPWWIARKLARAVGERISYELSGGWEPAPVVLKRGSGSCSEYTFAFIALCRIAGLPARYVGAVVTRGEDASFDEAFHRWAQVYLPPYGWVDWDVQAADSKLGSKFAENLCKRANRYLVTTIGGGPSKILKWDYNSAIKFQSKGRTKILVERYAEWAPENSGF